MLNVAFTQQQNIMLVFGKPLLITGINGINIPETMLRPGLRSPTNVVYDVCAATPPAPSPGTPLTELWTGAPTTECTPWLGQCHGQCRMVYAVVRRFNCGVFASIILYACDQTSVKKSRLIRPHSKRLRLG